MWTPQMTTISLPVEGVIASAVAKVKMAQRAGVNQGLSPIPKIWPYIQ